MTVYAAELREFDNEVREVISETYGDESLASESAIGDEIQRHYEGGCTVDRAAELIVYGR